MANRDYRNIVMDILRESAKVPVIHSDSEELFSFVRAVAKKICGKLMVNSVNVYRYNYCEERLSPIGGYFGDGILDKKEEYRENFSWMSDISCEAREASVSYRCASQEKVFEYHHSYRNEVISEGRVKVSEIYYPYGCSSPNGDFILSLPIPIFDKVWGVVEIISSNSFDGWAFKGVRYLMKYIGIIIFQQMSTCDILSIASMYDDEKMFVEKVCGFLLSSAAALWRRDSLSETYYCEAYYNRVWCVKERVEKSIIAQTFDKSEVFRSYSFDSNGVLAEWLLEDKNKDLIDGGFKYITIIPVIVDGEVLASLSLYGKTRPHSGGWKNLFRIVSETISIIIVAMQRKNEMADIYRRRVMHESKNVMPLLWSSFFKMVSLSKMKQKGEKELDMISNISSDFEFNFYMLAKYMKMNINVDGSSSEYNHVNLARENKVLRGSTPFLKEKYICDVLDLIDSCMKPLSFINKSFKFEWKGGRPNKFLLYGGREDVAVIVNNLSQNAIKYGSVFGGIILSIKMAGGAVGLVFSNLAPPLSDGDVDGMWKLGYRGDRAIRDGINGDGMGLYYAKQVAKVYGWSLIYKQSASGLIDLVWHNFSLVVPEREVDIDIWNY